MHWGVDAGIVFGRQRGKTRTPIQGLSIRWGFSRYEAQKMSHTIQSEDYVPGVSGWKIDTDTGAFELSSDRVTVSGVDPKALYSGKSLRESQKPFIVVDGVTYIRQEFIEDRSITKAKIGAEWSVRIGVTPTGEKYATGLGLGDAPEFLAQADRFAIHGLDASEILRYLSSKIDETSLGQRLREQIDQSALEQADKIREVIRAELKPGGLLNRSN